jgi:NAD+ synthase
MTLQIAPDAEARRIVEFLRTAVRRRHRDGAVVGLSGGVDSAVVAALAVAALGAGRVLALAMPDRHSAPDSLRDARRVAGHLGIPLIRRPITSLLRKLGAYRLVRGSLLVPRSVQESFVRRRLTRRPAGEPPLLAALAGRLDEPETRGRAMLQSKNRLRMTLLYLTAEQRNAAVLGTLNRSEWLCGLFVPHGDAACEIAPILHLYKTQVYALAEHLELPPAVRRRPPSPDLAPGLTDADLLGLDYQRLDPVLAAIEAGEGDDAIATSTGVDVAQVAAVRRLCTLAAGQRTPSHLDAGPPGDARHTADRAGPRGGAC